MARTLTHGEYVFNLTKVEDNNYRILTPYRGNKEITKYKHLVCGKVFEATPQQVRARKCGCPYCAPKYHKKRGPKKGANPNTLTNKEFLRRVGEEPDGDDYRFLEPYITADDHIKVVHDVESCGHEYTVAPSKFFLGRRCPKCALKIRGDKKRLTHEDFVKRIEDIHGGAIEVIGKYTLSKNKIKVKHEKCGREYQMVANKLLQGHSCYYCYGFRSLTEEEFRERLEEVDEPTYTFEGRYVAAIEEMKVTHTICGTVFEVSPHRFITGGARCPYCSGTIGEKAIEDKLIGWGLRYERQKTFDDCRHTNLLRFDFYLGDFDILIEFDGEQHYRPIDFFGGEESFKETKVRDEIKNEYCEQQGKPLIRVPYWYLYRGTIGRFLENKLMDLGVLERSETANLASKL